MALTLTERQPVPPTKKAIGGYDQGWIFKVYDVQFDSSYATGGEALAPADVGLDSILWFDGGAAAGRITEYDYANSKLKAFQATAAAGAHAEVGAATDLSSITVRCLIVGTKAGAVA